MTDRTPLEAFVFFTPTIFPLGRIVSIPGALDACSHAHRLQCLARHARGDWSNVSKVDAVANDKAVKKGFRILSA
jgi:hypothetical protein